MKFNVHYVVRVKSSGEVFTVPGYQSVECANLASLLVKLSGCLPSNYNCETIGIRIDPLSK